MNCVANSFSKRKCLRCHKFIDQNFFPFCSEKCKLADLHHWLTGNYIIATDEMQNEDADIEKS
ncbi:DNA gyrase inhibitor YacG [Bartonella sp. TP]|uniref:DNA gyrase inhibitor YacG n=1 Tax=Bartonella sp. TP TaxID=3057550 RepID=UPI0025B18A25|nr:DNA gyrase inhibitor YacG [Bartonella sp. TP]WJW79664.1 DNA gyrase inhibitor YacG [Bartonella sp. TP]